MADITPEELERLSAEATEGPLVVTKGTSTGRDVIAPEAPKTRRKVAGFSGQQREANAGLHAALVNAYRSGLLVHVSTLSAEREANKALLVEAREALNKIARREVANTKRNPDWPRRVAQEALSRPDAALAAEPEARGGLALLPCPFCGGEARRHVSPAFTDVIAERRRQVEAEGWTAEHDDTHVGGEMATAAACYAYMASATDAERARVKMEGAPYRWPWDEEWWKPKDRRRDLLRAAALLIAEIERLDRAALPVPVEEA